MLFFSENAALMKPKLHINDLWVSSYKIAFSIVLWKNQDGHHYMPYVSIGPYGKNAIIKLSFHKIPKLYMRNFKLEFLKTLYACFMIISRFSYLYRNLIGPFMKELLPCVF